MSFTLRVQSLKGTEKEKSLEQIYITIIYMQPCQIKWFHVVTAVYVGCRPWSILLPPGLVHTGDHVSKCTCTDECEKRILVQFRSTVFLKDSRKRLLNGTTFLLF